MKTKEIYDILRAGGLSHAGALGMIGSMMAEAGPSLPSNITERGRTSLSDEEYTRAADAGTWDFVNDAVGYGLCQWTYWSRKRQLLDYARSMGVSVGDGVMQVHFALAELKTNPEFAGVSKILHSSDDIDECADVVCRDFERPAVCDYANRRAYAHQAEKEIGEGASAPAAAPVAPTGEADGSAQPSLTISPTADVVLLQTAMALDGAWDLEKIDGINTAEWRVAFRGYVGDVLGYK